MRRLRLAIFFWLPVVAMMVLIFGFSGDTGSFRHSSRIIEPFLRWAFPSMSVETRNAIVFFFRKGAHVTEYAILTLLVWRALRASLLPQPRSWSWSLAGQALWFAIFYAVTDEFHQTFVPSREGCIRDVAIDTSGAMAALFVLWLIGRGFKKW